MAYVNGAKPGNMKQYTGRVSLRPRKLAEQFYKLQGGPWDGHTVALATSSTMPISVGGGKRGWYVSAGDCNLLRWVDL